MKKLQYRININAAPSSVWQVLTEASYYSQWIKAFSPNSYFEGEWPQNGWAQQKTSDI